MNAPTLETPSVNLPASERAVVPADRPAARINIPLNLNNWRHLPEDTRALLMWFHQFILDGNFSWADVARETGYDNTVIYRVLKGSYEGNLDNVLKNIRAFRKRVEAPLTLQSHAFVDIAASRVIFRGLSYALKNHKMLVIIGESGQGKSVSAQRWKQLNNHGRSVMVIAPAYGGTKALFKDIAKAIGLSPTNDTNALHEGILRGFNHDRILVVDEAHRLLPSERSANPVNLEVLRDLHDRTGCAVALIATARLDHSLRKGAYMFEQVLGRSRIIRLKPEAADPDIAALVQTRIQRPAKEVLIAAAQIARLPGRLRILAEVLKVAADVAASRKIAAITTDHFFAAIKLIEEVQGEPLLPKP